MRAHNSYIQPTRRSRHRRIPVLMGGRISYSDWLTENFPDADRWDHQDISGSSVLEASYTTALSPGRELVPNSTFEIGVANWSNGNNAVISQSAAQAHSGSNSGLVTVTTQDDYVFPIAIPISAASGTYDISVWVYLDGGTVTLFQFNGSNMTLSPDSTSVTGLWVELTATGVPIKTITANPFFIRQTVGTSNFYIDDVSMKQTGILASSAYPGAEELNEAGASGTATAANWTGQNNPDLSNPSAGVFRVARIDTNNPIGKQDTLIVGVRYRARAFVQSDGNGTPTFFCGGQLVAGTTSGDRELLDIEFTAQATEFMCRTLTSVGTQYADYDTISVTPVNPMNGTTVVSVVGVPTNFGSLGLSVVDDGATSYSDIHSAEINSKFNPAAGFFNIWTKIRAASVWSDGIIRAFGRLAVDGNNQVFIWKAAANNTILFRVEFGSVIEDISIGSITTLDEMMLTVTWKKPGNAVAYINGASVGTPQAIGGTWVGNLDPTLTLLGAFQTTPSNVLDGSRTRFMLGYEQPTDAQVLSLYNQGRR